MARPRKTDAPDLTAAHELTAGIIERLTCPPDKPQAFLRDAKVPGLRVRVTQTGFKAYVFEARLHGQTIRRTIGDVRAWTIEAARAEARRLAVMLDTGTDPRELDRQQAAERVAQATEQAAQALTVGEVWGRYMEDRRPHWSDRHHADHLKMVEPGGRARSNRPGVNTVPGPLAPLLALRLADLTPAAVEAWAAREAKDRPARVRLALRLLKAFLRWSDGEADLKGRADPGAAGTKRAREVAGRARPKNDVLQREQLPVWFRYVRQIQNPVIAAYLQCLLLTGARREELAALRWEDVNFQWRGMAIRDKVEGERTIPLPPYMARLIAALPRRNEWVFSSVEAAGGHIVEPSIQHRKACAAAGLEGLTLHGLRRSFASLCEWLDIPGGVSAQIQGHAPQGVREQNYIRRPLDLLRVHHDRIEAWILEQAGIEQPSASEEPARLRAV